MTVKIFRSKERNLSFLSETSHQAYYITYIVRKCFVVDRGSIKLWQRVYLFNHKRFLIFIFSQKYAFIGQNFQLQNVKSKHETVVNFHFFILYNTFCHWRPSYKSSDTILDTFVEAIIMVDERMNFASIHCIMIKGKNLYTKKVHVFHDSNCCFESFFNSGVLTIKLVL